MYICISKQYFWEYYSLYLHGAPGSLKLGPFPILKWSGRDGHRVSFRSSFDGEPTQITPNSTTTLGWS